MTTGVEELSESSYLLLIHLNDGKISAVQDNGKCGEVIDFPSINNGENFGYINIGNGSIYILNEKKMFLFNFDQNPTAGSLKNDFFRNFSEFSRKCWSQNLKCPEL